MASAAKKKSNSRAKGNSAAAKVRLLLVFFIVLSAVFLPTAFLLLIGLLPMFVAFFVDRSPSKTKAVTVGAMNLAGCMPFLMDLWMNGHTLEKSISIIADPMAIVVMYSAAGVGYLIDWSLSVIVANFMYTAGQKRKAEIEKRQGELIERWGQEVTGSLPLDEQGFPLD